LYNLVTRSASRGLDQKIDQEPDRESQPGKIRKYSFISVLRIDDETDDIKKEGRFRFDVEHRGIEDHAADDIAYAPTSSHSLLYRIFCGFHKESDGRSNSPANGAVQWQLADSSVVASVASITQVLIIWPT